MVALGEDWNECRCFLDEVPADSARDRDVDHFTLFGYAVIPLMSPFGCPGRCWLWLQAPLDLRFQWIRTTPPRSVSELLGTRSLGGVTLLFSHNHHIDVSATAHGVAQY